MKVLVIGGSGYIGSYLSKYLDDQQFSVTTYGSRTDDYNDLSAGFLGQFEYIVVLAGHSSVPMCNGPLKAPWNNNVRNMHNLIQRISPDQKIIYASSSSVYGTSREISTESNLFMEFLNNYDLTKISLDNMASVHMQRGANLIGLRFGTVNGGSPVLRRDIMLNSMVYSARTTGKIMVANREIYRPILWIRDLGRAIKAILTTPWKSGFYNVASFNASVWEMAEAAQTWAGGEIVDNGATPGAYDFRINTRAFEDYYKFTFEGTPGLICEDLKNWFDLDTTRVVTRDQYFDYKG